MSAEQKKIASIAPEQALGYSLQYTHLTSMLLDAQEGSICSLEVLDDVASKEPDGTIKLSQTKSYSKISPVSNRAISLWKTLYNWLKLVEEGHVDPKNTIFELYSSKKFYGHLVSTFNDSSSEQEAKTIMDPENWTKFLKELS